MRTFVTDERRHRYVSFLSFPEIEKNYPSNLGVLNAPMMFHLIEKWEHIFNISSLHFQQNLFETSNYLKLSRKIIHVRDTSREASIKPCSHIIS